MALAVGGGGCLAPPESVGASGLARPALSFLDAAFGDLVAPSSVEISFGKMQGFPAAFISQEDMVRLAKPFSRTLVGKFLAFRPPVDVIRSFVRRLNFFGKVMVDPIDKVTVSFRFADNRDYICFFTRHFFKVFGCEMRVVKWSPFSDFSVDSPILPLWILFLGLRYQLFHAKTLMDIAATFGKPLCVDSSTVNLRNLEQARVLVEIDTSVAHPDKIWIGDPLLGSFQKVVFENLHPFCALCNSVGHLQVNCVGEGGGVGSASAGHGSGLPADSVGALCPPSGPLVAGVGESVLTPAPLGLEGNTLGLGVCNHPVFVSVGCGPADSGDAGAPVGVGGLCLDAVGLVCTTPDPGGGNHPVFAPGLLVYPEGPSSLPFALGESVLCPASPIPLLGSCRESGGDGVLELGLVPPGVDSGSVCSHESEESIIMETLEGPQGRSLPASFRQALAADVSLLNPLPVGFPTRGMTTRSMSSVDLSASGRKGAGVSSGRNTKKKKRKARKYENYGEMAAAFQALFKPPNYD